MDTLPHVAQSIEKMLEEQTAWHAEHATWMADIKRWREETRRMDAVLFKLERAMPAHIQALSTHEKMVQDHEKMLIEHGRYLKSAVKNPPTQPDSLAELERHHRQQAHYHNRTRSIHQAFKQRHEKAIADIQHALNLLQDNPIDPTGR